MDRSLTIEGDRGLLGQALSATLERLGEPFVSTNGSGRGLGTLNVKKMVGTVHGGRVELDSEVGKGTRVALVLPRKQPSMEELRAKRKLA